MVARAPIPTVTLADGSAITLTQLHRGHSPISLPLDAASPLLPAEFDYKGVKYSYPEFLRRVPASAEAFSFLLGLWEWPVSTPLPPPRWCFLKIVELHRDDIVGVWPRSIPQFMRALGFFRAWLAVHHKVEFQHTWRGVPSGAWWCQAARIIQRRQHPATIQDPATMPFESALRLWWRPYEGDFVRSTGADGKWDASAFYYGVECLVVMYHDLDLMEDDA